MKKYKLIKEYPGSPGLGYITSSENLIRLYREYPEFWEEIVEKDYEILSWRQKQYKCIVEKEGCLYKEERRNYN